MRGRRRNFPRSQVITGVFVDSAIQTSNSQRDVQIEREMELKDSFLRSLREFFDSLDTDGSGSIHLEEIKIMLQDSSSWLSFGAMCKRSEYDACYRTKYFNNK